METRVIVLKKPHRLLERYDLIQLIELILPSEVVFCPSVYTTDDLWTILFNLVVKYNVILDRDI